MDKIKHYKILEEMEVDTVSNGVATRLVHEETGARVIVIRCEDDNKVFNIGFKTPSLNSKGTAHIVEHTVLCGSQKYRAKDPFVELVQGSLNTFLNAMTYPDKTVYPVASRNLQDFHNLMDVYLDAVFFPRFYEEEKIFRQEGWHYELDSLEGPLRYNGVVFNEMKGVFSDAESCMERMIQRKMNPDNGYQYESGGDPEEIPELSYEEYLDFHRRYYHPSNSYIYLYGDLNMEEELEKIHNEYLSKFSYLKVDSEIEEQAPFQEPQKEVGYYAVGEEESIEDATYLAYVVELPKTFDRFTELAMELVGRLLVNRQGAPVKKALLEAGIGKDVSFSGDSSYYQPVLSFQVKGANEDQMDDFIRILEEELKKFVEDGPEEKSVLSRLNHMEYQLRKGKYENYPNGLMMSLEIFDYWLYNDERGFEALKDLEVIEKMRNSFGQGVLQDLVKEWILDNPHKGYFTMLPDKGLTGRINEAEEKKLADLFESMSKEEREQCIRETRELKKYQEEPTPPEDLETIPRLSVKDLEGEVETLSNIEEITAGTPVLWHDYDTNGICYLKAGFYLDHDLMDVYPYLGLIQDVMRELDTTNYTITELMDEIILHLGEFGVSLQYHGKNNAKHFLMIKGEFIWNPENMDWFTRLANEVVHQSIWAEDRVKQSLTRCMVRLQDQLIKAGHASAMTRCLSYFDETMEYAQNSSGLGYYKFLKNLLDHWEEEWPKTKDLVCKILRKVFSKKPDFVEVTMNRDLDHEVVMDQINGFVQSFPKKEEVILPKPDLSFLVHGTNEGFKTASRVQYVAQAGNMNETYQDGTIKVLSLILNYHLLWNEVRVKGGAYGVFFSYGWEKGSFTVSSYRDPNLKETYEIYNTLPEMIRNFQCDEREMEKFIIGTYGNVMSKSTVKQRGEYAGDCYWKGITLEERQKYLQEILSTTPEKVRKMAEILEKMMKNTYVCTIGNEEKVEEQKELFDSVQTI